MPLLALSGLIVFFVFLKNGKLLRLFHHLSTGKYKQAYDTIYNKAREIVLVFRRARQGYVSTLEGPKSLVLLIIHPEYGVISPPQGIKHRQSGTFLAKVDFSKEREGRRGEVRFCLKLLFWFVVARRAPHHRYHHTRTRVLVLCFTLNTSPRMDCWG
jgi:hypothetical protein